MRYLLSPKTFGENYYFNNKPRVNHKPINIMNKLIVIRHSERLDEVNKAEWKNILFQNDLNLLSTKHDGRYNSLYIPA